MRVFGAAIMAFVLLTGGTERQANAAEFESVYTSLDLETCLALTPPEIMQEEQSAEWVCPGHDGLVVWVGEGDLRMFLGYGPRGREQCSYGQTLSRFNMIGETLEWRLERIGNAARPIATILRYRVDADGVERQYLVVSKVGIDQSCHMAYIDVAAGNANQRARDAADGYATDFQCGSDSAFLYSSAGPDQRETPASNPVCPSTAEYGKQSQ